MNDPITIRMGGYGPPTTSFSRALKLIGETLEAEFGDRVSVKYVWNIMDFAYRAQDILWLVEHGVLTLGYQSSSYLTDRVPELEFVDLPFLFERRDAARAAIDGALGQFLAAKIEQRVNYRESSELLRMASGIFQIGCGGCARRPISKACASACCRARCRQKLRTARRQPDPLRFTEAIAAIKAGTIDAQENPSADTVTYGVHKFHHFHTVTNHFYISRPIFLHRPTFGAWPADVQRAMRAAVKRAVAFQRDLAIEEDRTARAAIEQEGCEITALTADEHSQFRAAVAPLLTEAQGTYGRKMFKLI